MMVYKGRLADQHKQGLKAELALKSAEPMWIHFGNRRMYMEWLEGGTCFRLRSAAGDGLPLNKIDESTENLYEILPDHLVEYVQGKINGYRMDLI